MQSVRYLPLSELHLWTENPRDPISENMSDGEIIRRAIEDKSNNWHLDKLLSDFGSEYHQNKLPVVVIINDKYVIYDGNRRIAMLKCIQDDELFALATGQLKLAEPPDSLLTLDELPCCICDQETALDIVEKDHRGAGKWGMLQYEWFLHYHKGQPKGTLAIVEEALPGSISATKLNEEYARTRLLTKANLNMIGFDLRDGHLITNHTPELARNILSDLATAREQGKTSHRHNAGDVKSALIEIDSERYSSLQKFSQDKIVYDLTERATREEKSQPTDPTPAPKRRPRLNKTTTEPLFGGKLYPKGRTSNQLYRALEDIHGFYRKKPADREHLLPIIAMGLRLLLDITAREYYFSGGDPLVQKDDAYKTFLKRVAKPALSTQLLIADNNEMALTAEWLNGEYNLEAILGKWAHGSLPASPGDILKASKLVGAVIQATWSTISR